MDEQIDRGKMAPKWASLLSGVLTGWLIFLFSSFLILIVISALVYKMGVTVRIGSVLFFTELIVVGVLSLWTGSFSGRRSYKWFIKKTATRVYIYLSILIFFTLISFPLPFKFINVR